MSILEVIGLAWLILSSSFATVMFFVFAVKGMRAYHAEVKAGADKIPGVLR